MPTRPYQKHKRISISDSSQNGNSQKFEDIITQQKIESNQKSLTLHYSPATPSESDLEAHRPEDFDFSHVDEVLNMPQVTHTNRQRFTQDTRYQLMPFIREKIYEQDYKPNGATAFLASLGIIAGLLIGVTAGVGVDNFDFSAGLFANSSEQVAKASESETAVHYNQWVESVTAENSLDPYQSLDINLMDGDTDNDGLTNYQEYLLQSNPFDSQSCLNSNDDASAMIELLHPGTCSEWNWSDKSEIEQSIDILTSGRLYDDFANLFNIEITPGLPQAPIDPNLENTLSPQIVQILEDEYYSQITPTDIQSIANYHDVQPSLIIALTEYTRLNGFDASTTNNITGFGNQFNSDFDVYTFGNPRTSIEAAALLISNLEKRSVPDCSQITLLYRGDFTACSEIEEIYLNLLAID